MKKLKAMLLLALSVAALGAFAAPAAASGANWVNEMDPIVEPYNVDLDGSIQFLSYQWGGTNNWGRCDFDGEATLLPDGEGEVTKFDLSNCVHPKAPWCTPTSTPTTAPWSLHAAGGKYGRHHAVIEDMSFTVNWGDLCTGFSTYVYNADIDLVPEYHQYIEQMDIVGNGGGPSVFEIRGGLVLDPAGTIGIQYYE